MNPSELEKLLPIMSSAGVLSFEDGDLKIAFHPRPITTALPGSEKLPREKFLEALDKALEKPLETVKVNDVVVPQGLSEEMPMDKILHWSSPDSDFGPVPLADDSPLTDNPPIPEPTGV